MFRKPHRPTRLCPHRFCRPAHSAVLVVGLVWLIPLLYQGGVLVLWFLVAMLIGVAAWKLINRDRGMIEESQEDRSARCEVHEHTVPQMTERKGWSRTAVALDIMFLLVLAAEAYFTVMDPVSSGQEQISAAVDIPAQVGAFALLLFYHYAHKKGTSLAPAPVPSTA